jgi:aminoglycoside 6-adenylyltransferase
MRSEREMLKLIMNTAVQDDRIRAVIMNGSRVNPGAPRDIFQDFDIVYLVTDVTPFKNNLEWIKRFGELMILQMPEDIQDPPPENNDGFVYLMQFLDGNRIDLGIFPLSSLEERVKDSLSVALLDKDGILPRLAPANESSYLPQKPTEKSFQDCCNEFWWLGPYVAKGLWRQEIIYARGMFDQYMREELMKMLTWHIGVNTHFSLNPGKMGKYFQRYLEPELWELLQRTYTDASYENTWGALFKMCELFRITACHVAAEFNFDYPYGDDERVSAHLKHVRSLPGDAKEIY